MVKSLRELHGTPIEATDGNIGSLQDVYFDDRTGHIRYFVVDTAKWLPGRRVVIAPQVIRHPWHDGTGLPVDLTREQVKSSPAIDSAGPVSRETELLIFSHYGWVPYWVDASPPLEPDSHVQSCRDMLGYEIRGTDGKAGTLDDVLIDPEHGTVRFVVVKTGEWLSHKQVLLSPAAIGGVNWADAKIETTLSRHAVESCPEYRSPG
jgi:sporulation protein YlmC with PRC-barrel domain